MANQKPKIVLPQFFIEPGTGADDSQQIARAPIMAARQASFAAAVEVFAMLAALPDAFIRSQRRELKRLQRSGQDDDARIEMMKASIGQSSALHTTARLGQARLERMIVAMSDQGAVVHGFVSDDQLEAIAGLTVRLSINEQGKDRSLFEKTGDDGYFSIRLGSTTRTYKPVTPAVDVSLSERMAEALARINAKAAADAAAPPASTTGDRQILARIEILDATGKLLHTDPEALVINTGSVYREYVLLDREGASKEDFNNFVRDKAADASTAKAAPTTPLSGKTPPSAKPRAAKPADKPKGRP